MGRHWLLDRLAGYGERPALLWRGDVASYTALEAAVLRWLEDLRVRDVRPGECVAICADYSLEACALLLALSVNRNIAALLPRSAEGQRPETLQIASVGPIFVFEHGRLVESRRRRVDGDSSPLLSRLRERGSAGLILFSSGSTGGSKASLIDFDRLLRKFDRPLRAYRTLSFLLMDHVGGLNVMLQTLCSGGGLVLTEDRSADAVCEAIEDHEVELLPTTPTFLKMLLIAEAHLRYRLTSLKLITYGAEPMPESTLGHLRRALPSVELRQNYGLTELGVLRTRSRASDSLWVQLGGDGYAIKVVDGTLRIKTDSAMLGYLNAPSPFDEEGWFDTGDLVEVDGEHLRILGRASELINVGGEKVYPAEVESVLLEIDNIADAVVTGKRSPIAGQVVVAKVSLRAPEPYEDLVRRVRAHCKGRLAPYKIPAALAVSEAKLSGERGKKTRLG